MLEEDLMCFDSSCKDNHNKNISSLLNANIDANSNIFSFLDGCEVNPQVIGRESLGILSRSFIENEFDHLGSCNDQSKQMFSQNSLSLLGSDVKFSFEMSSINKTEPCVLFSINSNSGSSLNKAMLLDTHSTLSPVASKGLSVNFQRARLRSLPSDLCKMKPKLEPVKEVGLEANVGNRDYNDLLSIEARHLADKIADGSIFNDSDDKDNSLNSTAEPVFVDSEPQPVIEKECDVNEIFKCLDKMLPPVQNTSENSQVKSNNNINLSEPNCETCEIFANHINTQNCIATSGDATGTLEKLTTILQVKNKNEEQLCEGLHLIRNLLHILYELDNVDAKNKLNGSKPSPAAKNDYNDKPLDLSVKSNFGDKDIASLRKNAIAKSIAIKDETDKYVKPVKLKPKKLNDIQIMSKKGPMKAMPLSNCINTKDNSLTANSINIKNNSYLSRNTSTPCKSKLKPIAQSTPESDPSNFRQNSTDIDKVNTSQSPLSRRCGGVSKMRYGKEGKSGMTHSYSNPISKLLPRRSTSDLKAENVSKNIKRSNSIGDGSVSTAAARAREMVSKKIANFQQNNFLKKKVEVGAELTQNKNALKSNLKSLGVISKMKTGKENTAP